MAASVCQRDPVRRQAASRGCSAPLRPKPVTPATPLSVLRDNGGPPGLPNHRQKGSTMPNIQDMNDALTDIEVRSNELIQAQLSVSSAIQNLVREQDSLRDILTLLAKNWE